jgi:hypothetical protein
MKWILSIAIAGPSAIVAAIILYIATSDSNHTALDIRYAIPVAIVFLMVALLGIRKSPGMAFIAITLNLFALAFVYAADQCNVMVQYEEWIDRGMPDSLLIK